MREKVIGSNDLLTHSPRVHVSVMLKNGMSLKCSERGLEDSCVSLIEYKNCRGTYLLSVIGNIYRGICGKSWQRLKD